MNISNQPTAADLDLLRQPRAVTDPALGIVEGRYVLDPATPIPAGHRLVRAPRGGRWLPRLLTLPLLGALALTVVVSPGVTTAERDAHLHRATSDSSGVLWRADDGDRIVVERPDNVAVDGAVALTIDGEIGSARFDQIDLGATARISHDGGLTWTDGGSFTLDTETDHFLWHQTIYPDPSSPDSTVVRSYLDAVPNLAASTLHACSTEWDTPGWGAVIDVECAPATRGNRWVEAIAVVTSGAPARVGGAVATVLAVAGAILGVQRARQRRRGTLVPAHLLREVSPANAARALSVAARATYRLQDVRSALWLAGTDELGSGRGALESIDAPNRPTTSRPGPKSWGTFDPDR